MSRPPGSVALTSTCGVTGVPSDQTRKSRKLGSAGGIMSMLWLPAVSMPPGVSFGTSGIGNATRSVTGAPVSLRNS